MYFYITPDNYYSFYKPDGFYREIIISDMEDTLKNQNILHSILQSLGYKLI